MELKLNIGYQELIELIKQLPLGQIRKLQAEINLIETEGKGAEEKNDFQEFLLQGPVMEDDQYQDFLVNRAHLKAWRTN